MAWYKHGIPGRLCPTVHAMVLSGTPACSALVMNQRRNERRSTL